VRPLPGPRSRRRADAGRRGDRTRGDRHAAQAAYLGEAVGRGRHPLLAAALAEDPGTASGEDPQAVFERTLRRMLSGLVRPR
jgi:hypothetical protein